VKQKAFSEETKLNLIKKARYRCENCHSRRSLTFHHKKHRSSGKEEDLSSEKNGCVLCQECHMIADNPKTDKEIWDFSIFNTMRYQKVGETQREHLTWEHEQGIKDWGQFITEE